MNKLILISVISVLLAVAVTRLSPARPFEEQLISLQAQRELGNTIKTIKDEPIEVQAILLDYSDNPELVLKTQLALMKYPQQTRKVLSLFGSEQNFMAILLDYGEIVIPVIHYFLITDIKQSIRLMDETGKLAEELKNWWNGDKKRDRTDQVFGPQQQAWYGIQFIKNDGYDFLGQFEFNDQGKVKWIQTERVTEGLSAFFTSGVRKLETHYVTDQEISTSDLLWAGVDVLAVAGTFRLLRAGRYAARSEKSIAVTRQTALFGSRLLKSGLAGRLLKYSAVGATAFVIIKHPSLMPSLFAQVGQLIGIPSIPAQIIGVSILAFVLLYPAWWLLRLLIRPLDMMVKFLIMILTGIERRLNSHNETGVDVK